MKVKLLKLEKLEKTGKVLMEKLVYGFARTEDGRLSRACVVSGINYWSYSVVVSTHRFVPNDGVSTEH